MQKDVYEFMNSGNRRPDLDENLFYQALINPSSESEHLLRQFQQLYGMAEPEE